MTKKRTTPNLTEGPIVRSLITLSIPIIFANVLQTAYQLIDTFWVGRLGANAVAAVSLSFPPLFLLISLASGLAIAGTVMVAQSKGKGDLEKVNYISTQTLLMILIAGISISIIGYAISTPLIKLMGAEPEVFTEAVSYLKISFIGIVFMFGFFVYQSLMRGLGEVKIPLILVLSTVILNLFLDPLFIMGWGPIPAYGVAGAAIASIGTEGLAAIVGIGMLFSGKYEIQIKLREMKFDFKMIKKLFMLGFPASISQSVRALGMMVMIFLVASFDTIVIASYGIGGRILSFIIIPAVGISMATSTLVGQNIGAGKIDRAEKVTRISSTFSFILLTGIGILIFALAEPICRVFIPESPQVIESGTLFVKIMALTFGFMGLQQTINGAFNGSGKTKISMMLSIISFFVLQFPLAFILSKHTSLGAEGIYWAFPIANILSATITLLWYKTGSWKTEATISS